MEKPRSRALAYSRPESGVPGVERATTIASHRRTAYLGGTEGSESNHARLHGYLSALMSRGITVDPAYIVHGRFRPEHGFAGPQAPARPRPGPTAIFAANDGVAVGVLKGARRQGIRIPDELKIVGFDGTTEDAVPALTSVSQSLQQMGRAAVRSILRQARQLQAVHGWGQSGLSTAGNREPWG